MLWEWFYQPSVSRLFLVIPGEQSCGPHGLAGVQVCEVCVGKVGIILSFQHSSGWQLGVGAPEVSLEQGGSSGTDLGA